MTDEDLNLFVSAVTTALTQLMDAIAELETPVVPQVPMPRPRIFQIASEITWPGYFDVQVRWGSLGWRGGVKFLRREILDKYAVDICEDCGWQPSKILRAVRAIQTATSWCYKRRQGRQRASQEILRQQHRAREALAAEVASKVLGGGET